MVYIHPPKQLNKTAADAIVACPHSGTSHVGVNQRRPKKVPIKIMYHIQHPETLNLPCKATIIRRTYSGQKLHKLRGP